MWILKKINNNCALARDDSGQDLVVFGKGVGFRRAPYELKDLSGIERTFYGFGSSSLNALSQIPEDIVLLASDIMEHAAEVIDVDFNPNAPVTLADHIQFAIQRLHDGLAISTPLAFDVSHLYPKEYAVGKRALTLVSTRLGVELPEAEATNVALHIINAESERGVMGETLLMAEAMDLIVQIVERRIGRTIDRESFSYARFMMHLRFLVARLMAHESSRSGVSELMTPLVTAYPETHACVREIMRRLEEDYGWHCDESEELYLTVHIQRVKTAKHYSLEHDACKECGSWLRAIMARLMLVVMPSAKEANVSPTSSSSLSGGSSATKLQVRAPTSSPKMVSKRNPSGVSVAGRESDSCSSANKGRHVNRSSAVMTRWTVS